MDASVSTTLYWPEIWCQQGVLPRHDRHLGLRGNKYQSESDWNLTTGRREGRN